MSVMKLWLGIFYHDNEVYKYNSKISYINP